MLLCAAVEQRPPGYTVRNGEILVDTVKRDADLQQQAAAAAAAAGALSCPMHGCGAEDRNRDFTRACARHYHPAKGRPAHDLPSLGKSHAHLRLPPTSS